MKHYQASEHVKSGVYFDPRHLRFRNMDEPGELPDDGGRYLRVPLLFMLVVGPVLGLIYAVFLPFIGFAALAWMAATGIGRAIRRLRAPKSELKTVTPIRPDARPKKERDAEQSDSKRHGVA